MHKYRGAARLRGIMPNPLNLIWIIPAKGVRVDICLSETAPIVEWSFSLGTLGLRREENK